MNFQLDYSAKINKVPFFHIETIKAGRLLVSGHTLEDIKSEIVHHNLFQLKTEDRRKEVAALVLKRLAALDTYLLDKLVSGVGETAKQIVLYAIMKTDRLFYEFMREVFKDKLIIKEPYISAGDFSLFFQNKVEQSATVAAWTEYTFYKLQQVYTRILYEAGFIKKGKDKLEIIRPIMDKDVADHLKRIGDGQFVDILQGV